MAAPTEGQAVLLFDLPDETLEQIVGYLPRDFEYRFSRLVQDHHDIARFRATCRRALRLCEQSWCQFISINNVDYCQAIHSFLAASPHHEHLVQRLQLHATCASRALTAAGILEMTGFLSRFSNLKYQEIEPVCGSQKVPEERSRCGEVL
ncbi:hypothetical protein CLCR_03737 [Cladophialophora carrionii]|uniref:F-box domain-containing protein n=1 Tax=Cladophialophora carrionii TaxID=86049 RepID=A0A1C1CG58_9EURO|nr:hypothetical protein CLCR_03737 [Cladophialophora carrionii]